MKYIQLPYAMKLVLLLCIGASYSAYSYTPDSSIIQQRAQSPSQVAQRLITSIEHEDAFKDILKIDQQQQLLEVLYRVAERAARDDSDGCDINGCGTGFAGPCGNSTSADLEVIRQTLCCITNTIGTPCGSCCVGDACADLQTLFGFLGCLCSKIDVIGSTVENIDSSLDVIESKLDACCTQLNSKMDVVISTVDEIESGVDVIDSKLDACCTQLNSKLDVVDSSVDVIDSKLDLCCNQVNSKLDVIESVVDGLGSGIDVIDSKLDACCTQLNSKLDVVISTIDDIESGTDVIDSKLDACCTQLNSKLDVVDSSVDVIDSKLDLCCSQVNSKLDVIESVVDGLGSGIDVIDSKLDACCTQLNSKMDVVISTIDDIESGTDVIDSKLDACCTQLNSKLNVVDSSIDVIDSKLDLCCSQVNSKLNVIESVVDGLGSGIDVIDSKLDACCTQLNSKLDVVNSSVDVIDSKLDLCCSQVNSKLNVIESVVDGLGSGIDVIDSKLDACCTQLNSKLDVVNSSVDVIDSKLDLCCSQVNSKLDILLEPCTDCCALNANDLTFSTEAVIPSLIVLSVDWSFDSKYAVVGYQSNGATSQARIQIFSYDGTTLASVATYSDTSDADVDSVRFSPINYQLLVARAAGGNPAGTLQTYIFDPIGNTITQQGTGVSSSGEDFVSVAWHPNGNFAISAHDGNSSPFSSIVTLYSIVTSGGGAGNLASLSSLDIATPFPDASASNQAIDWNPANTLYAAVGTFNGLGLSEDLFVIQFDSATNPTTINGFAPGQSFGIQAFSGFIGSGVSTTSVSWHPSGNFLAAGGAGIVPQDRVKIYTFASATPSLTFLTSIESRQVVALDWDPIVGDVLSYAAFSLSFDAYVNYCFNSNAGSLSFLNEFDGAPSSFLSDVRWSPNEKHIVTGGEDPSSNGILDAYNFDRPSCAELALRLLCKANSKLDFVDSKLDLCCGQVNSKLDLLLAPCVTDCCVLNANDITFSSEISPATFPALSVDWSFDSKYVVVGYQSFGAATFFRIQVLAYNGTTLLHVADYIDDSDADVNSVRFSPINYQILAVRAQGGTSQGTLQTYIFNPSASSIGQQGTGQAITNADFVSVAWHPSGTFAIAAHNSPAGSPTSSAVSLYPVNAITGDISASLSDIDLTGAVSGAIAARQALDWNNANPLYAAVGTQQTNASGNADLFVIGFNSASNPSGDSLAISQVAFTSAGVPDATLTVDWHPLGTFLAAGAAATVTNDHVQVFSFDPVAETLTEVASVPIAVESHGITELDWSSLTGNILSYVTNPEESGDSFLVNYCFSYASQKLSFLNQFDSGFATPLNAMRWSPNEATIATGGSNAINNGELAAYNFDRPSCSELALRLLCKESSKLDIVDSKIDLCCSQLNSKLDLLTQPCPTDFSCFSCTLDSNSIKFKTSNTDNANFITSVDWSFDSQYVVYGNFSGSAVTLEVFKYSGGTLTSVATFSDAGPTVNSVRFSPINYQMMVARAAGGNPAGTLQTYIFDPIGQTITAQGTGVSSTGEDFVSVAWHPNGSNVVAGHTDNSTTSTVTLYSVIPTGGGAGNLTSLSDLDIATPFPGALVQLQALDWNRANTLYAAAGTSNSSDVTHEDLFVIQFDSATNPTTINSFAPGQSFGISAFSPSTSFGFTIAVNWHPSGRFLAAGGGSSGHNADPVVVYTFDTTPTPNLIFLTSIPVATESRVPSALDWDPITGDVLSYVANTFHQPGTSAYVNYCFSKDSGTLAFLNEFDGGTGTFLIDVRWSPDEKHVATGDDNNGILAIYDLTRPNCLQLIPKLLCKESSKLDVMDTTVNAIDSKLDLCCEQVNNKLDTLLEPCITDCCLYTSRDITFATQFITPDEPSEHIMSVDWSFDSKYVVIGYADNLAGKRIEVFELTNFGYTLVSLATFTDASGNNVNSVRFSPTNYQIAVVSDDTNDGNQVAIYKFTPPNTLTFQSGLAGEGYAAVAVTWHPNGRYIAYSLNDPFAFVNQLILTSVDPVTGTVAFEDSVFFSSSQLFARQAIDWNKAIPTFITVGTQQLFGAGPDLYVYQVNDFNNPTTFSGASTSVDAFDIVSPPGDATLCVNWHPSGKFLAAGGAADVTNDHVQVYAFDPIAITLTEVTSIPLVTESRGIDAIDWSVITGNILSYVTDASAGDSFFVNYCFNNAPETLSFLSAFDTGFSAPLTDVRWSPNEANIATGGWDNVGDGVLTMYDFDRPSCSQLALRLLCRENSKLDAINAKIDLLIATLIP